MVDEIATHESERDATRRVGDLSVSAYVFGVVTFVPLLDRSWHTHSVGLVRSTIAEEYSR